MKIALLTPTFSKFSGIDRLVEQKAIEFSGKGHKVTIFSFEADMQPKNAELKIIGMPKNPLLQRIYRLLFFLDFAKVGKYVREMKDYDAVISFFYPMNIIASKAKKKYGKRYIYYNAGVAYPRLFSTTERIYLALFNFFTNRSIMNADHIYSISEFCRRELKKETGRDSKVEYVKIDHDRFNGVLNRKKIIEIRKKYGITGKALLYVGRISPHKGVHLLLKAFQKINKEIPDLKLLIVGKHTFGNYSKELKKLANQNVIFAGYVPDEELPYYYGACDVYATCSLWEGFDIPACITPDSKIKCNNGFIDISKLQTDQKVATHKAKEETITSIHKRAYNGDLYNISIYGCKIPLKITPEHRVYAIPTKKCKTNRVCKPGCSCKKMHYKDYKPSWVKTENLKKGYALIYPYKINKRFSPILKVTDFVKGLTLKKNEVFYKYSRKTDRGKDTYETVGKSLGLSKNAIYRFLNKRNNEISLENQKTIRIHLEGMKFEPRRKNCFPSKIKIDENFMRLAGYYLSEGCATSSKTNLIFSFHSNETEYQKDVLNLMENIFHAKGVIYIKGNGCRIYYSSQLLNLFFSSLFGKGAKNKHIPENLISAPRGHLIGLIKGLWRGDGTIHADKKGNTIISYSTSSQILAEQLRDSLLRIGIISNISFQTRRERFNEFKIEISGKFKMPFCRLMGTKCSENKKRRSHNHYWIDDKYLYSIIRKIKKEHYQGTVHNLEVNKEKSYVTIQGAVHNCEAQAVGKPAIAFDIGSHKEVVKRGILIEEGNIEKFAEEAARLLRE
ncbi:glycosyltransferase [Candidatus Woesearchaeota archaeon]|nr:glycosyltransferase [Candidatus Woesearchaeota archaeon]